MSRRNSDLEAACRVGRAGRVWLAAGALTMAACSRPMPGNAGPTQPVGSLQQLMQGAIDPAADGLWNAVKTVTTAVGDDVRQPQSPAEWLEVRRAAVRLEASAELLQRQHWRVGDFPAESAGALDSAQIQRLIDTQRPAFDAFAAALSGAARQARAAIDARNPSRLMTAGGATEQICEGCHLTFWYPKQVIPTLPSVPPLAP